MKPTLLQRLQPYRHLVLILTMCFSAALVFLDSGRRYDVIEKTMIGSWNPLPELSFDSPTGYELGMRKLILPTIGTDGYQWIMHTQRLLEKGGWRIRFTDQDNYPFGREIHWSHSFIWWLIAVGWVHSLISGWPLPASVEAVAPYANTLFLAFFVLVLPLIVYRRLGLLPACAAAFGPAGLYAYYEFFVVGNPDHHGLAAGFCMMAVLFLGMAGAGWVRASDAAVPPSGPLPLPGTLPQREAARWMVLSAISMAVVLWISAATAVPALAGLGLGAVGATLLFAKKSGSSRFEPGLWRIWGAAGGLASLAFYLLEYFPSHMGMRLEVNHPLYALAWFCAGDLLARFGDWIVEGRRPWASSRSVVLVLLSGAGVVLLPALIVLAPDRFFWVSDPFLWLFHKDYILEFRSLGELIRDSGVNALRAFVSPIPLLLLFIVRLLFVKELGTHWKGLLLVGSGAGLFVTLLAVNQIRWFGVSTAIWLAVFVLWLACVCLPRFPVRFAKFERFLALAFVLAVVVQYPFFAFRYAAEVYDKEQGIGPAEAYNTVVRDLAHHMRRANPDRDVVVLSGPTTTNWLMYYGNLKGIGTLYWENVNGLKGAGDIYSAKTEDEARRLVEQRHLSHVAIFSADPFSDQYARLKRGLPPNTEVRDSFSSSLLYSFDWPQWVVPLHYALPSPMQKAWIALLEVRLDQSTADFFLNMGRYFATRHRYEEAIENFRKALSEDPNHRDAQVELAGFLFLKDEREEAERLVQSGLQGRDPDEMAEMCFFMASLCETAGRHKAAAWLLEKALQVSSTPPTGVVNKLAWLLSTSPDEEVRNPERALKLAEENTGLQDYIAFLETKAAALAANEDFHNATLTAHEALLAAEKAKKPASLLKLLEERRDHYARLSVEKLLRQFQQPTQEQAPHGNSPSDNAL
ncbi:MAG: tetratricopeptide repeat protein [Verrucomicrobiia bacterium]